MNQNEFWLCPHCNTTNNSVNCRVCGYTPGSLMPPPPPPKSGNKTLLVAIIIVVAALLIATVVFLGIYLLGSSQRDDSDDKIVPVVSESVSLAPTEVKEDTYYVNKFTDSGIYVREAPSRSSRDILYIPKGDQTQKLRYLGEEATGDDGYRWFKVETPGGETGYVREDVVVVAENADEQ